MKTVHLTHDYPVSPERLWALATDYGALARVMEGVVAFEGLPEGRVQEGQKIGPVTLSCRSDCSLMQPLLRRPRGFSSPMLSAFDADCRSR